MWDNFPHTGDIMNIEQLYTGIFTMTNKEKLKDWLDEKPLIERGDMWDEVIYDIANWLWEFPSDCNAIFGELFVKKVKMIIDEFKTEDF